MFEESANVLHSGRIEFLERHKPDVVDWLNRVDEFEGVRYDAIRQSIKDYPIRVISVKEAVLDGVRFELEGFTGVGNGYEKDGVVHLITTSTIPYAIPEHSGKMNSGVLWPKLADEFGEEKANEILYGQTDQSEFEDEQELSTEETFAKTFVHELFHSYVTSIHYTIEPDEYLISVEREEELATEFSKDFFKKMKDSLSQDVFRYVHVKELVETEWRLVNQGEKDYMDVVLGEYNKTHR